MGMEVQSTANPNEVFTSAAIQRAGLRRTPRADAKSAVEIRTAAGLISIVFLILLSSILCTQVPLQIAHGSCPCARMLVTYLLHQL